MGSYYSLHLLVFLQGNLLILTRFAQPKHDELTKALQSAGKSTSLGLL